jgi:hypothetical protein
MTQHYLATPLRRVLERTIKEARVVAEAGAADAIRRLGVAEGKAPAYLSDDEQELRRRLRAHARTLGDRLDRASGGQEVKRLVEAAAYAHWHRMLFARFLAERGLLRHPEHNVPVTLEDCREIAQEEGAADAWAIAERYAASMLPAVFSIDDPVLSLTLDAAQSQSLHRLVTDLDNDVFQAEDSLGWTYQFWRAAEKDAVNKAGVKIGADEISAVTQLFTEPYMVRFLLHNTLGAWWAGKILAANPELAKKATDENALRTACSLPGYAFDMLRFVKEGEGDEACWRPAAGTFAGWPKEAKAITMLDPCCGSGHFLTEALTILAALREAEEGLSASDAVAAVLSDNLHGLEIDGRCVQIAAFAVALTAWRIGGWQILPLPHIAWVGAPPPLPKLEFVALAEGDKELERALAALHDLFSQAPILGSLLDPTGGDLVNPMRIARVARLLEPTLQKVRKAEPELAEGVVAARGIADAASILNKKYTLQATNVPFLGRGKQAEILSQHIEDRFSEGKADLATAMVSRMRGLAAPRGSIAAVTPQNWLYLGAYKLFRQTILANETLDFIAPLGARAFETIGGEVVSVALTGLSLSSPAANSFFGGIDANDAADASHKASRLRTSDVRIILQKNQLRNADSRISFSNLTSHDLVTKYAVTATGIQTFDRPRFVQAFWEQHLFQNSWIYLQTSPDGTKLFGGCTLALLWEDAKGRLFQFMEDKRVLEGYASGIWRAGSQFWGKPGVLVNLMNDMPATLYCGYAFDQNVGYLGAKNEQNFGALWSFASSDEFGETVREVDQSLKVTNATLGKIPFDFARWKNVHERDFANGIPEPYSDDPAQWIFHGHPAQSAKGTAIHVALARFCGYRWPAEADNVMRLSDEARERIAKAAKLPEVDQDGLLAIAGVAGEKPLADRLRAYLAAAFGAEWSDALERRLVAEADEVLDKRQAKDGSLETWLRDRAFRQHCALFQQRPFLWHIWDGLKDGFSVFIHYHRFTQANLRKLTYTMLGDWLARAKAESNDLRYERARELQQMLEKVLEGEAPYDIFVRWKPLAQQPLGWEPDLDDGVRMNIRPFMEAGILREQPKGIKWTKDRGNDVPSAPWYPVFKGERINDHHTTLEEKLLARVGNPQMVAAK